MKINKFIIIIIIMVSFLFASNIKAKAARLTPKHYTISCIYSDGGLYTREMNLAYIDQEVYNQNRISYNLRGVNDSAATQTSNISFVNQITKIPYDTYKIWRCQEWLYSAVYKYNNEEQKSDENGTTYYKFMDNNTDIITNDEFGTSKNGWEWFWGVSSASEDAANAARNGAQRHKLVSEYVVLSNDAPAPNMSLYYVQEATQASGTNKYIEIMIYDNVVLLRSESLTTTLYDQFSIFSNITQNSNGEVSGAPETIWINEPEPLKDVNGSKITYYHKQGQTRYQVLNYESKTYGLIQKYTLTDEIVNLDGKNNDDLCIKIMPQTAVVLRDVIKYAQFLIPILLIVLTGFDIGKIVVTGNIDEELPKQRKKIVIRLIAAIVVFFLPLIVSLIINLVLDSSDSDNPSKTIQVIDCLFN